MVGAVARQQGGDRLQRSVIGCGEVSKICGYATVVGGRPWEGTESVVDRGEKTEVDDRPWVGYGGLW